MSTDKTNTVGHLGLGLLVLMAIALVAGESRSGPGFVSTSVEARAPAGTQILFERVAPYRDAAISGAIRELRVIPATIDSRLDLGWSTDEYLVEQHQRAGL
jgi:hypothetical protein